MNSEENVGQRLSSQLTYLLKHALIDLQDLQQKHLRPFGINERELAVLLFLDGREPESQQQAASRLGVDRTTMVSLLDALEAKGLVARRPDPGDRRRNVVEVTDIGRKTLAPAVRASDEAERQLLSELDGAECTQLRALLRKLGAPE